MEVMVTIGIISVMLSLTLPSLMGARIHSMQLKSLANSRATASDFQAYADAMGRWPFAKAGDGPPGFPADLIVVPTWPPGSHIATNDHWALSRHWPGVVATVAPWETHYETWLSPGRADTLQIAQDQSGAVITPRVSYVYSHSFIASPALWSGSVSIDLSTLAPTRPVDVAHPSTKTLIWDADLAYLPNRPRRVGGHFNHLTPMAFADGHAAVHNPLDATPGVDNPLTGENSKLFNTPHGVLGRDY